MTTNTTNITKLNLNDTFYDWYITTNQIIDFIVPIKIYDVLATDGLYLSRDASPGTVTIGINTNPSVYAIDTKVVGAESYVILDIQGLTSRSVANSDVFVFSPDSTESQVYKVQASNILPPSINGDHNFLGNITTSTLSVSSGIINLGTTTDPGLYVDGTSMYGSWYYDYGISAWISGDNLGLKAGTHIVSDSTSGTVARFPFYTGTGSLTSVDIQLKTTVGSDDKNWSITSTWGNPYQLEFAHFTDAVEDASAMSLEVYPTPTNGVDAVVRINDTIAITDVLNSEPFSQVPVATNIPITDSTNGFLNKFVNRVKLPCDGSVVVGKIVRVGTDTAGNMELLLASASTAATSFSIGIVESVSGGFATVVTSGEFTIGSGYTPGSIYYLQNTAGNVGTSAGTITKPVFVATTTTSGIIVPDFASGSTGLNNAFSAISIQGEGTYPASGATTLTFKQGTGINLTLNTNNQLEIAATTGLPTAGTYSVYNTNASSSAPTTTIVNPFSVLGRSLNGNIESITVNPGSVLARRDDTDDSNNAIESISFSELRSIMGFTGSSYIKTINFRDNVSTLVKSFNASDSETVEIQAGSNIQFQLLGSTLRINATGDFTNGSSGDGTQFTSLTIGAGNNAFTNINSIDFSDSYEESTFTYPKYIKFRSSASTEDGFVRLYAVPGSDFMTFSAPGSGSVNFRDGLVGKTVFTLKGDTKGVKTTLTSGTTGPIFTVGLDSTITVSKIKSLSSTAGDDLILSATSSGRDTLTISDQDRSTGLDSFIKLNAYDTNVNGPTGKVSVAAPTFCVSLYSDKTTTDTAGNTYTYPFRFHKIIAEEIEVQTLDVATSFKETANLSLVSSDISVATKANKLSSNTIGYLRLYNDRTGGGSGFTTGSEGYALQFMDGSVPEDPNGSNTSYILHPDEDLTGFTNSIYRKSLIFADKIAFANLTDNSAPINATPTIGWGNLVGGILVESSTPQSYLKFKNTDTNSDYGNIGIQDGYAFMTYGNNISFRLKTDTELIGIESFVMKRTSGSGIKIQIPSSVTNSDVGGVAVIDTVSSGVGNVAFKRIIKPYSAYSSLDPVGTLYYN